MDSGVRPPAVAAEDEAQRRGTDCIYFLASPLTCKKGSECEYRHSDAARVNPRDCWYWFNGSCLNPKCSFRHPPLDGLLGAPVTPRAVQPAAPQVSVLAPDGPAPANSTTAKQGVPCYYFQKGTCLKGDRCTFVHVPQVAGNPPPQQTVKVSTPTLQAHNQVKNSWALKPCTQPNSSAQQNKPVALIDKQNADGHNLVGVSRASAKPAYSGSLPNSNPTQNQNLATWVEYPNPTGVYHNHRLVSNAYVLGRTENYQARPSGEDELIQNGVEAGEFVREPSAGSGVLAASVNKDTEYSRKKDANGRWQTNGEHFAKYERELRSRMLRQAHDSSELEQPQRGSSGSVRDSPLSSGRRISKREPIQASTDGSDLRHRLLKQRRLNDSRSASSRDGHGEYLEERRRDHRACRGQEEVSRQGSVHSRLHGRIKLPGRTSSDGTSLWSEKEQNRGPRGRRSPPRTADLRGKLHDRLRAKPKEDIPEDGKSFQERPNRSEDAGVVDFARPKSLAELKAMKVVEGFQEQSDKGASFSAEPGHLTSEIVVIRESADSVQFEGPKPLSVILKRKKRDASGSASDSDCLKEDTETEAEAHSIHSVMVPDENKPNNLEKGEFRIIDEVKEEDDGAFHPEDEVAYDDGLSPADDNAADTVDDLSPADDSAANTVDHPDQELEEHQEPAEEYNYEAMEEIAEEGTEYEDFEDNDLDDDDDDDDFARKVGAIFS